MTNDEIYRLWRPDDSPWSPWVKPILFSFLTEEHRSAKSTAAPWHVPLEANTAIIADLAGATGTLAALALFRNGYRPVPVYNATPFASTTASLVGDDVRVPGCVDLMPIMNALCRGTRELAEAPELPQSAPPVFCLDWNRHSSALPADLPADTWLDNRSFISATDFPSAQFLLSHGISRVVYLQLETRLPYDSKAVLLSWQNAGIAILRQNAWEEWMPIAAPITPPTLLSRTWDLLSNVGKYQRDPAGNFGALVRRPSASG